MVYQKCKNGSTYAYRLESYRDPKSGKPRSRREYLGRVDPKTGEIIPKRPKRRRDGAGGEATDASDLEAMSARIAALEARSTELEAKNAALETAVDELTGAILELQRICEDIAALAGGVVETGDDKA